MLKPQLSCSELIFHFDVLVKRTSEVTDGHGIKMKGRKGETCVCETVMYAACHADEAQHFQRDERRGHQVVLTRCRQRLCFTVSSTGTSWKQVLLHHTAARLF